MQHVLNLRWYTDVAYILMCVKDDVPYDSPK